MCSCTCLNSHWTRTEIQFLGSIYLFVLHAFIALQLVLSHPCLNKLFVFLCDASFPDKLVLV